ncbi:DNA replication/repair protein RecF [Reichenbachiella versicolor]|uniref:DNA replication/repair protein RecF n=1 Tax=Reichenbachiella versicolor TaxID=1821036 RepID=UPI000D6E029C|nr:DNA replication/repair protein RecF [Reichenbachiella versicolor]
MYLQSLDIINFKNYNEGQVEFCDHINCLVGLNGSGKTNLLDAIYYLSMTKSYFNSLDGQNIKKNEDFFVINAEVQLEDKIRKYHCSLKKGEKKTFKVDGAEYEKMSEHLGKFPAVMIAPADDELIRESNDVRRKYFDSIIAQTDKIYLAELIRYNHHLKQRNALLKSQPTGKKIDKILLEGYDRPMIESSKIIAQKRLEFIQRFEPIVENNYELISEKRENVNIEYKSKALLNSFEEDFANSYERDLILQRTNVGVHKDEYLFTINDMAIKKFGSQGQQKSFLISLKLAQFEFVKEQVGLTPVLLLDDIFDKLDDGRIGRMLEIITSSRFKQIFITDAREERTMSLVTEKFNPVRVFRIDESGIKRVDVA